MSGDLDSSKWLSEEDSVCFDDRLSRLSWLAEESPSADYWLFPGGFMAKSLFEETRYCFVYGQFQATTLLGLAYIERTLSALFYAAGRNDLKRASLTKLLKEAHDHGLIGSPEFRDLEKIRKKRNSYAHFRNPEDKEGVESRSVATDEAPYDVIQRDATEVIVSVLNLVAKASI